MSSNPNEFPPDQEVWVELETHKGTNTVSTYRGRLTRAELEAWAEGRMGQRCLRLRDAYWAEDVYPEDPCSTEPIRHSFVILGQTPGKFANFTGEILIRTDTVVLIMPLRDGNEWHRAAERNGQLLRLAPK